MSGHAKHLRQPSPKLPEASLCVTEVPNPNMMRISATDRVARIALTRFIATKRDGYVVKGQEVFYQERGGTVSPKAGRSNAGV